jgi:hypothetical protein
MMSKTADRRCAIHDEPILWEPGGDDRATIHGHWYCPSCSVALWEALEQGSDR